MTTDVQMHWIGSIGMENDRFFHPVPEGLNLCGLEFSTRRISGVSRDELWMHYRKIYEGFSPKWNHYVLCAQRLSEVGKMRQRQFEKSFWVALGEDFRFVVLNSAAFGSHEKIGDAGPARFGWARLSGIDDFSGLNKLLSRDLIYMVSAPPELEGAIDRLCVDGWGFESLHWRNTLLPNEILQFLWVYGGIANLVLGRFDDDEIGLLAVSSLNNDLISKAYRERRKIYL